MYANFNNLPGTTTGGRLALLLPLLLVVCWMTRQTVLVHIVIEAVNKQIVIVQIIVIEVTTRRPTARAVEGIVFAAAWTFGASFATPLLLTLLSAASRRRQPLALMNG